MNPVAEMVYVGSFGTWRVPLAVLRRAEELNAGKPLTDGRTKGAKHIDWWGRMQDSNAKLGMWLDHMRGR